jgi:hypothetical protein
LPLPVSENREHLHTRTITMQAFRRDDGLMDVEGHLTDIKPFEHQMMDGFRRAGEPVHDLSLRIALDDKFIVVEAEACMDQGAHDICSGAEPNFSRLIGLQIGPGWNKKVKAAMSPGRGCTHIIEMLAQMATAAMQASWSRKPGEKIEMPPPEERQMESRMLNACYPYHESSPWVEEHFPNAYIPLVAPEES